MATAMATPATATAAAAMKSVLLGNPLPAVPRFCPSRCRRSSRRLVAASSSSPRGETAGAGDADDAAGVGAEESDSDEGSDHSSSPSSLSASYLWSSRKYAFLKRQMAVAAESENFEEAARLRDSLRSLEEEEPVIRLQRLITRAIQEERFEDAAKYRDELKAVNPDALLKSYSDATTLGIRVQVKSVYIAIRSRPGQYFFAYRVRITNNSEKTVQLLRRHWVVTDGNGRTENVYGVGVVGLQPVIYPGTSFQYSSACPLETPNGKMEGEYELKYVDQVESSTLSVTIAPFALSVIGNDSDALLS